MKDQKLRWVLLGYVLLTILLTYPLGFRLTELMLEAGTGEDAYASIWNIWWIKKALLDLKTDPYITDFIFYPDGTNLALHTLPLPGSILGAILSAIRPGLEGLFVGYNLVVLVSFVLSALGTYLLVHRLTGSRSAAFVSGIVFAFTHYRFSNTVRLHSMETGVLPFCAWALVSMVEDKKVWQGCLVGFLAALALYSSKEYFVQLLLGIFLALIYLSIREPSTIWTRRMLYPKLAGAFAFIILSLPIVIALARPGFEGEVRAMPDAKVFSADGLDFLVPNPRHPLFGSWSVVFERGLHEGREGFGLALPLVGLVLSIWAVVTGERKRAWPWAALGILFFLLSLGPVVHLGGHVTGIPSLYRGLTAIVPWLGMSGAPMRYVAGLHLTLAILVGFALTPARGTGSSRPALAALLAAALLIFETLSIPLPMTPVNVHPYYGELAANPADGGVLEIPPRDRASLLHQTVHGRKIPAVRSVYLRSPGWSLTFWQSDGLREFTDSLFRPEKTENLSSASLALLAETHRRHLLNHGIRFVALTKNEIPPAERQQALMILHEMAPQQVFEDEVLAVFQF